MRSSVFTRGGAIVAGSIVAFALTACGGETGGNGGGGSGGGSASQTPPTGVLRSPR